MRRVGDVLPHMAQELGLEEELRTARAMTAWGRLVEELVPAAAGTSRLLAIQPPALIVSASEPILVQELHLRAPELLAAFAGMAGGQRCRELRVVLRRPPDGAGSGRPGRG